MPEGAAMFARRKSDRDALRAIPAACDLQAFIDIQSARLSVGA